MKTNDHDYIFNLVLLNGTASGKTSILNRFVDGEFYGSLELTIGVDLKVKYIEFEKKKIKLLIWDTAGQDRSFDSTTLLFPGMNGFILVYDITDENSFNSLPHWIKSIKNNETQYRECMIVGNKCDLSPRRTITEEKAKKFANENEMTWMECSAKTNENINEIFYTMTKKIFLNKLLMDRLFLYKLAFYVGSEVDSSVKFGIGSYLVEISYNHENNRDLSINDFQIEVKIDYPQKGSQTTYKHGFHNFKLTVHGAEGFRYLRRIYNVKDNDIMDLFYKKCLSGSSNLYLENTNEKLLLEYLSVDESETLKSIIIGYGLNLSQNILKNQLSILPIIYGFFTYLKTGIFTTLGSIFNDNNSRVVLVNNALLSELNLHEIYELNGCLCVKVEKNDSSKSSARFNDLDFLEKYPNGILLDPLCYEILIQCLNRDCAILKSFNIINYSFLLGVHNLNESATEFEFKNQNKLSPNLARTEKGERLLIHFGIVNIFEKCSFQKKLNASFKRTDKEEAYDSTSYANKFIEFLSQRVFKKSENGTVP